MNNKIVLLAEEESPENWW